MPEETDVQRGGGADAPVEFRWNDQLHRVRSVLTHHRLRSYSPPNADALIEVIDELSARRAARAGRPASAEVEVEVEVEVEGEGEVEVEVWRVRASPAVFSPTPLVPGVFDLHFDWAVGRWTVTRIDTLEEEL